MSLIDRIITKAQQEAGAVILPEPEDGRTLLAAATLEERRIARVILVGDRDLVSAKLKSMGITRDFEIVDPKKSDELADFAHEYYEMRKHKGLTEEAALAAMSSPIPHGIMLLNHGVGDGLVAGACHSTGDTLRPALQILRTAPGCKMVSSFFFMGCRRTTYLFADCAIVENPTAEQLAEIAVSTAHSALAFGLQPNVAMLSYSTKGSAHSILTEKVVAATQLAQDMAAERFGPGCGVCIDGELQVDAAVVEAVAKSKAPGSPLHGKARVLIFPDLNSGNIAYKLVQRLAGATAIGPILQGIRLPVNDLSRGCSAEDIVGVSAVTVIQGKMLHKVAA